MRRRRVKGGLAPGKQAARYLMLCNATSQRKEGDVKPMSLPAVLPLGRFLSNDEKAIRNPNVQDGRGI